MGFTVPGSNAGGGFGLGGIAGGLGALLQGLVQGHQMKLQNEQAQQQLTDERLKSGLSTFDLLSHLSPEALNNPAMQPYLQNLQKQGGSSLPPIIDATGKVNTSLFQQPLSQFTASPLFTAFNQLPQGSPQREQMLSGFNISDADKQSLLSNPQTYTPAEQDAAAANYTRLLSLIGTQGVDPKTLVSALNTNAERSGNTKYEVNSAGEVVPMGGGAALGMGAKATAATNSAIASTNLKNAYTQKTLKATSWMDKINAQTLAKQEAETGLTRERIALLPVQVQAQVRNSLTAAGHLDLAQQRLGMDMQAFQKLGTTPQAVNAYRGLETTIQSTTNQARVAADAATRLAETYKKDALANGADITNDPQYTQLVKAAQNANGRYQNMLIQSKQFTSGYQQFANTVLHKGGAPNTWQAPKAPPAGHTPSSSARFSPDRKQYWDQGVIYDAATNRPVSP